MATQTTNYGFEKPAATDKLSVLVNYNGNLDLIDSTIKTVSDAATTASSTATAAQSTATAAQTAADAAQSTATAAGTAAAAAASAATAAQSTADSKAAIDDTAAAATTTYSSNKIETELATKQATITGAATSILDSNLTTNRALISNSTGKVEASSVTSTQLGYLSGVTSNIQSQINSIHSNDNLIYSNNNIPVNATTVTIPNINNYVDLTFVLESPDNLIVNTAIISRAEFTNKAIMLRDFSGLAGQPASQIIGSVTYISNTQISIQFNGSNYKLRVYAR